MAYWDIFCRNLRTYRLSYTVISKKCPKKKCMSLSPMKAKQVEFVTCIVICLKTIYANTYTYFKTSIAACIKNPFRRTSEHKHSYNYLNF